MKGELIVKADSVDLAVEQACAQLEKSRDEIQIEILNEPKKSLFGKIKEQAEVKFTYDEENKKENKKETSDNIDDIVEYKTKIATEYLEEILSALGIINLEQEINYRDGYVEIILKATNIGIAIGRRGETLDAIQYLVSLVANRCEGDYVRFIIDSGNFRKKREETLKALANKIARKAIKTGRNTTLEPMNPYERRIIHSVITNIEGVYSKSIGDEPNRKVVVIWEGHRSDYKRGKPKYNDSAKPKRSEPKYDRNYEIPKDVSNSPSTYDFEKEFLKNSRKEQKLYTKIDLDD